ncbi:hypothetical protein CC2G_013820 [Coprinopsis cinerea AmutBmut pab1-1]|nr:hypothetical protein CC2G_013820 [Coprinopsis cinerea AmutBmut pab1-1]
MFSIPINKNVGKRGTTMAVACVTVVSAALGAMYIMGRDVKGKEQQYSPYETQGHGIHGTDKAMTSGDVAAAVGSSFPKPKDRLHGAVHR